MCYMWKIENVLYVENREDVLYVENREDVPYVENRKIWAGRPGSYQIYYPLPPNFVIPQKWDPYWVVDNAMVYKKFCSGVFTIGGMTSWEGGQVEILFKSAILG